MYKLDIWYETAKYNWTDKFYYVTYFLNFSLDIKPSTSVYIKQALKFLSQR